MERIDENGKISTTTWTGTIAGEWQDASAPQDSVVSGILDLPWVP
jgi:hypothetical protein